jgi:hypothetical protein
MTKEELKQLSDQTFYDNNVGGIEASKHRNFNNKLIESIIPVVDLASTKEQLTGELYNGKPVFMKNYSYGNLNSVGMAPINVANIDILPTNAAFIWIDYSLSFGYSEASNGIRDRRNAIPSTQLSGSDVFGAYINRTMLSMMGAPTMTYDINLCFKYTKI